MDWFYFLKPSSKLFAFFILLILLLIMIYFRLFPYLLPCMFSKSIVHIKALLHTGVPDTVSFQFHQCSIGYMVFNTLPSLYLCDLLLISHFLNVVPIKATLHG